MFHKIHGFGHQFVKANIKISNSKSNKSQFIKTQIKCFINGTKSRDYQEIKSHITLIRQFHFPKCIYSHLRNWLNIELNLASDRLKLVNVKTIQTHNQKQKQKIWKKTKLC